MNGEMVCLERHLKWGATGLCHGPGTFKVFRNYMDEGVESMLTKSAGYTKGEGKMDKDGELGNWVETIRMKFNRGQRKVIHLGKKNKRNKYSVICSVWSL